MNTFRTQSLRICRHNVSPLSKGSSFCNPPTAGRLPATVLGTSQQLLMADGGCSSGRRNSSFSTKICNKFYHTPTLYIQLNNKNRHTYNILYNNYNNIIKARSFSNNLRPYDDHELMYDAGNAAGYSDSDDEEVELYVGNLSYCKLLVISIVWESDTSDLWILSILSNH